MHIIGGLALSAGHLTLVSCPDPQVKEDVVQFLSHMLRKHCFLISCEISRGIL